LTNAILDSILEQSLARVAYSNPAYYKVFIARLAGTHSKVFQNVYNSYLYTGGGYGILPSPS